MNTIRVRPVEGKLVSEYNALKANIPNRYVGYTRDPEMGWMINFQSQCEGVEVDDNSYYRKCVRYGDLELVNDID